MESKIGKAIGSQALVETFKPYGVITGGPKELAASGVILSDVYVTARWGGNAAAVYTAEIASGIRAGIIRAGTPAIRSR